MSRMNGEHPYTPDSWQFVTTQVKESLGIKQLTKEQASSMLKLYIAVTCTEEIIKQMTGEKE